MKTKKEIEILLTTFYKQMRGAILMETVDSLYCNYTDIFYNLQLPVKESESIITKEWMDNQLANLEKSLREKKQLPDTFAVMIEELNEKSRKVIDWFNQYESLNDGKKIWLNMEGFAEYVTGKKRWYSCEPVNYIDPIFTVDEFLSIIEPKPIQTAAEINDVLQHQQPNIDPIKYLNADDLRQMTEIKPNIVYDKSQLLPQQDSESTVLIEEVKSLQAALKHSVDTIEKLIIKNADLWNKNREITTNNHDYNIHCPRH